MAAGGGDRPPVWLLWRPATRSRTRPGARDRDPSLVRG